MAARSDRFVARAWGRRWPLLGQVLRLCDEAGLVRPVVSIDGTRLTRNASRGPARVSEIARERAEGQKRSMRPRMDCMRDERGSRLPGKCARRRPRAKFLVRRASGARGKPAEQCRA